MMNIHIAPAINAVLNGLSTVFLTLGFIYIKRGNKTAHRNCMLATFVCSTLFLIGYVGYHTYRVRVLGLGATVFKDPAWFRPIYLTILISHTILAAAIVPLGLYTLSLALRQQFERHKKIARITWPVWMYVSITGVVIYLLLYQIFPQHG